jgi:hypothetical protein
MEVGKKAGLVEESSKVIYIFIFNSC